KLGMPGSRTRKKVAAAFPAAMRTPGQGQPSLKPSEWIAAARKDMPWLMTGSGNDIENLVENRLAAQVRHRVEPDLKIALEIAFRGFAAGGKDPRRFLDELALHMRLSDGKPFDLPLY